MKYKLSILFFLSLIVSGNVCAGNDSWDLYFGWLNWLVTPFKKSKESLIKYGAGQQAREDLNIIKEFVINNPDLKLVGESSKKMAESGDMIANSIISIEQNVQIQAQNSVKMNQNVQQAVGMVKLAVGVVTTLAVLKAGKNAVVWTKEYLRPGHDKKLKTATVEMHKCMFKFKHGSKDEFNMPTGCSNQLDKFEKLAGREALNHLRGVYNK